MALLRPVSQLALVYRVITTAALLRLPAKLIK
jgi:hypothetical protein